MTPQQEDDMSDIVGTPEFWFEFLTRKYVQSADSRQAEMGLQYMTAETHDLAKEIARCCVRMREN